MLSKKSLFALTLMIVLTVPMMMQLGQVFGASTVNVPTYLYVNVAPNPVGVNQTVYVSMFFSKPIPIVNSTAFFLQATLYTGLTINIIQPNGLNKTLGPFTTDYTGGVPAQPFIPSAVGNYTFQGIYPGQSLGTSATGVTYNMVQTISPPVTLVVQTAAIPTYVSPPLPTSYWTTPIYASNYGWAQTIGGNWYGLGRPGFDITGGYDGSGNNYQPYSTAPTTAHVLWTLPTTFGGQPGGETAANEMSAFAASSPLYHSFEPIILDGVLYYNWYPAQTDMAGIAAVNLFTGKTLWVKQTGDALIYGQVVTFHTVEEFGSAAFLWASEPAPFMMPPSSYDILDPLTGNVMATVTNVPPELLYGFGTSSPALIDSNEPNLSGSILVYYNNYTYGPPPNFPVVAESLTMWNSSLCLAGPFAVGPIAEIFTGDFKPSGTYNFNTGIEWSVPVPLVSPNFGISGESSQGILLTSAPAVLPTFGNQFGGSYQTDIAYNPITGALLWGPVNQTVTRMDDVSIIAIGDGTYVRQDKDTDQLYGYSLTTGAQIWGPTQLVGNGLSHIFSSAAIAYGQVYVWDIGGYLNAVNLATGKLEWTYTRGSAGYNTPYGVYPIWVFGTQSIADGMIFLSEGRCYDPPLFPGGEKLAINCTNGDLVWEINGAFQRDVSPIADSMMVGWNGYDGQIYAFGRGPSKTTVTAPDSGVTTATPVVITGTVTDISPGSQETAVAANFPNGLPCVSDASMTQFMEAVYEQQPMPTNVTGVPVTISVTDSNNNHYNIGTVYTNPNGFYSLTWTPIITGNYTVTATFAGTQSYYGSSANSAFYASSPAPSPSPYPSPVSGIASTGTVELGVAAVIIVIIVCVAVLAVLMLRKRP